ncbi:DUF3085 domain-containing protein [Rahnella aceris]
MLLFKNAVLKPVMEELQEKGGNMLLVKDEGIYLMAEKGAFRKGRRLHIAYAEGFDPRLTENEDWYEKAYLEVGGDDFGEVLGNDFWGTFLEEVINSRGVTCSLMCPKRNYVQVILSIHNSIT